MLRPVIYNVRHGETDWNRTGRLQGTLDIPLDGLGRRQAAQAGRILLHLIAANGANKDSLAFVASPLGRARATMELMRSELNMPLADYLLDDRLRELAESEAADPEIFGASSTNGRYRRWAGKPTCRCSCGCATGLTRFWSTRLLWRMAASR